jgi:hypothetical protein
MRVLSLAALAAGLLAACGAPASYGVRISYLRKMARQGVQANHLLKAEDVAITRNQCVSSYFALQDPDPRNDQGSGLPLSDAWLGEIWLFFVQSCITGLPKPVPGQAAPRREPARQGRPGRLQGSPVTRSAPGHRGPGAAFVGVYWSSPHSVHCRSTSSGSSLHLGPPAKVALGPVDVRVARGDDLAHRQLYQRRRG